MVVPFAGRSKGRFGVVAFQKRSSPQCVSPQSASILLKELEEESARARSAKSETI